jgi:chitinase
MKIPHKKICIGSAFYGREYLILDNHDDGLNQPAKFQKFITMKDIRKEYTDGQGYVTHWDSVAKASYKYNDQNKIFITYDDERSVAAKVKYVKDKKLDGIFFWEMRLDKPKQGLMDVIFREMKH